MRKPIFDSDEEAREFVAFLTDCTDGNSCICNGRVKKLRRHGYIKQSELEKALDKYKKMPGLHSSSTIYYVNELEKDRERLLNKIEELIKGDNVSV